MPETATLTAEVYPPGSELFFWDTKEARKVRVREIILSTTDGSLRARARHILDPIDDVPDPLGAEPVKPLWWTQAYTSELHPDREGAEAAGRN